MLAKLVFSLAVALAAVNAHAQRVFEQPELDALLAPIALYPDPLIAHVLNASLYPQDVADAAAWSRANPQLKGDAAVRTVEGQLWHPSVKALMAYPDVLARMAESPQWLQDLGEAFSAQAPNVTATVQALRARAQANGNLQSNDQQYVYQQDEAIIVQPVYPHVVYAPYYNPYVVYGPWWWTAYSPVVWRPWVARPYFVTRVIPVAPLRWHVYPRTVQVTPYRAVPESRRQPIIHSGTQFIRQAPAIQGAAPAARWSAPQTRSMAPPAQHQWSAPPQARWTAPQARWTAPQARSAPLVQQQSRGGAPQSHFHSASQGRSSGGGNRGHGRG